MKKQHILWEDWEEYKNWDHALKSFSTPPTPPNAENKECGAILFNGDSICPWQARENTLVMVTNRSLEPGKLSGDLFCRAIDVRVGDNVWEHNIVSKIELIPEFKDGIKIHYGSEQEANFIDEPDEIKIDLRDCLSDDGREYYGLEK